MTASGDDHLVWASGVAGEALDALEVWTSSGPDLGGMGEGGSRAVLAVGGADLVAEAVAVPLPRCSTTMMAGRRARGEALTAAGGADLVAEALAAAGGAESVAEALMPVGGADAVLEAVTIASRLGPT